MSVIRPAVPGESETIASLVAGTVRSIYPRYYPEGIVDFFVDHHSAGRISADISEGIVYVSEEDGEIVGTVTLRGDRMDRLFVRPDRQGRGLGRELILFSEERIFSEHPQMFLDAALPSVAMHHRNGFRTVGYGERSFRGDTLVFPVMVKLSPRVERD